MSKEDICVNTTELPNGQVFVETTTSNVDTRLRKFDNIEEARKIITRRQTASGIGSNALLFIGGVGLLYGGGSVLVGLEKGNTNRISALKSGGFTPMSSFSDF